jgi:glycolate oxidase FAD binding subunit
MPLSGTCFHDGRFMVRLSGAQSAVRAAMAKLGGEVQADADVFWTSVRDQTHRFYADAAKSRYPLWRLSVRSTAPYTDLGGEQLIEWGGAQRWLRADGDAATAQRIRATVSACGGHATLFRGGDKRVGVFQPLAPAVARIHERLKAGFDPAGIFNPGRMY